MSDDFQAAARKFEETVDRLVRERKPSPAAESGINEEFVSELTALLGEPDLKNEVLDARRYMWLRMSQKGFGLLSAVVILGGRSFPTVALICTLDEPEPDHPLPPLPPLLSTGMPDLSRMPDWLSAVGWAKQHRRLAARAIFLHERAPKEAAGAVLARLHEIRSSQALLTPSRIQVLLDSPPTHTSVYGDVRIASWSLPLTAGKTTLACEYSEKASDPAVVLQVRPGCVSYGPAWEYKTVDQLATLLANDDRDFLLDDCLLQASEAGDGQ